MTSGDWRLLAGDWRQLSYSNGESGAMLLDGARQPCYVRGPDHPALDGYYRARAGILVEEPPLTTDTTSVGLLLNAQDLDNTYRIELRVRSGVRYVTLTKHAHGVRETLADDIVIFDFDHWLSLEVTYEDSSFAIDIDGGRVVTCPEFGPLSGGGLGVGTTGTNARFDAIQVTDLGRRPPTPGPSPATTSVDRGRSTGVELGSIDAASYRAAFVETTSEHSRGVRVELFAKHDGRETPVTANDQVAVLTGSHGSRRNLFASMTPHPVTFTDLEIVDSVTARLHAAAPGEFSLTATWSLGGRHPRVRLELTAEKSGHYVIGYLGPTGWALDQLDEVLCGSLQHAKMVRGVESIGLAELSAPVGLVQHTDSDGPLTVGLFVPAEQLAFEYEPSGGDDDQPIGMSLRAPDGSVRPIAYAPQYGRRSWLEKGSTHEVEIGMYAGRTDLYEAYRDLLRHEYGYGPYRRNVFGASLTDTMHNLIDLVKSGPTGDDSVDFKPSPSGWWSRAKGFIDIENDQTVRTNTTSVLLSSYYLTGDDDLYERRALPTIEYHLSRNGYGWTPIIGRGVYGDTTKHRLCSTPFGAPALAPLHTMLRDRVAAVGELARHRLDAEDYWLHRSPMAAPLAVYRMTGDPELLRAADELGRSYVAEHLGKPYEDNVDPHDFQTTYSKPWLDLLEMYETTRDQRYLDAAHLEAKRFVTQIFVRPVPSGTMTVPVGRLQTEDQVAAKPTGWWDPDDLFDYPRSDVDAEEVPCWVVSPNGMGFEAMTTFRLNGYTLNPGWAPGLLRLAHHVEDDLLRDVAHNAVVGRYTNYPGYYYRQFTVHHLKPDFPYQGPFGGTTIYYHHAPGQLGMTIDFLVTEHETRSANNIAFPSEFEQNYVWFSYRVFGHRPGRFYGYDGVWLWMPRGLVSTGNPQVNWIAGEADGRLFVSLTNESDAEETVRLRVNRDIVPWEPGRSYPVTTIRDNGEPVEGTMTDGRLDTAVSGMGITAVVVHDLGALDVPSHRERPASRPGLRTYDFSDDTPVGPVRGILIPRPDGERCHTYVQAATEQPAVLHYAIGEADEFRRLEPPAYPNEWTVPIDGSVVRFTYYVSVGDRRSEPIELRWEEPG